MLPSVVPLPAEAAAARCKGSGGGGRHAGVSGLKDAERVAVEVCHDGVTAVLLLDDPNDVCCKRFSAAHSHWFRVEDGKLAEC